MFFLFNDTATTEIYTLSLHDALPIARSSSARSRPRSREAHSRGAAAPPASASARARSPAELTPSSLSGQRPGTVSDTCSRSEEHTSELQSRQYLVCRLLLEKKNNSQL